MKKSILMIVCIFVTAAVFSFPAGAVTDYTLADIYETYIYNSDNEPVIIPEAYKVSKIVTGDDLSVGDFNALSDIFYKQPSQQQQLLE